MSVYKGGIPYVLKAEVTEINADANRMILEVEYSGSDIAEYLKDGGLSFDLEAEKGHDHLERETYTLSKVSAKLLKTDTMLYRLECQLPNSVFTEDERGAVRVPFILGMQARVSIEIYQYLLNVPGRLRNLSTGGCMVEVDIAESIAVHDGKDIPGVTIEFPDGQSFYAEGTIRYIRPFGSNGYAVIGIQFINMSPPQSERLVYFVNESEREIAFRTGITGRAIFPSPLFVSGQKEKSMLHREIMERDKKNRQSPMQRGVLELAHRLHVGLMYLKSRNQLHHQLFYDCTDTLIHMIREDRKLLLFALSFLRDEPDWLRHAIRVSAILADMLLIKNPHDLQIREIVLGALLHTMGKPLLVSEKLPSLKLNMNDIQKNILKGHVETLLNRIDASGWELSYICRDVIENANENINGTGYPQRKTSQNLTDTVKTLSVIKAIDKLTHARNGIPHRTPIEAYRSLYETIQKYDKRILFRYIQTYGFYPIGSLARFSSGFVGWIMDINGKGKPVKVHLVKNLRFPETTISVTVANGDMFQIGKLEEIVDPSEFELKVVKN
ncbi:PilZ domain-containing protein [Pantoea sp. AS-PWVM4]|uniref:PilZ domain-containing protein n=1 Tax=Pantoea sp. AS-PWVM4 TaxID=1332069 RepID=UPI0009DC2600|nr:PilZ domain-containing protein [Pantoea sp. AS-PWVM4]